MFRYATGIGSFPHQSSGDALKVIERSLRFVPHWPQLPRRSSEEGFVRQYLAPLIGAGLIRLAPHNLTPFFVDDEDGWDELVLGYFELMLKWEEDELSFKNSETDAELPEVPGGFGADGSLSAQCGAENPFAFPFESAEGFYDFLNYDWQHSSVRYLKGQISGPVTIGFQVNKSDGTPAFYDERLREILVKNLSCQARWQLDRLAVFGKPVIIFIDEPAVYGYGTSAYVGLGRAAIQESIGEIAAAIKGRGGFCGVHCCAGVDWSLLLELSLDIVNFDAYSYFPSMTVYSNLLGDFLERGNTLAWGIVPTSDAVRAEDASSLLKRLEAGIDDLAGRGVHKELLRKQLMITPSCGVATLVPEDAERVYRLLSELEVSVANW